jgi:hypothetical protein
MVLIMMAVGVVLIPVRASQLYSRLAARRAVAGVLPGSSRNKRPYVVVSGWLSDVRGFNDFLQDCLVQVCGVGMCGDVWGGSVCASHVWGGNRCG